MIWTNAYLDWNYLYSSDIFFLFHYGRILLSISLFLLLEKHWNTRHPLRMAAKASCWFAKQFDAASVPKILTLTFSPQVQGFSRPFVYSCAVYMFPSIIKFLPVNRKALTQPMSSDWQGGWCNSQHFWMHFSHKKYL